MPNDYTSNYSSPPPASFRVGQPLAAADVAALLDSLNLLSGWVGSGMLWQQSWDAGDVNVASGVTREGACAWDVTAPSSQHRTVRVWVRRVGRGVITFTSAETGDDIVLDNSGGPADDGGDWVTVGDLTIGAAGALDTITMDVEGGIGGGLAVVQTVGELLALASPLPPAVHTDALGNTATPFDPDGAVAGAPLPAARGHQIARTLGVLMERPVHAAVWGGLSADFPEELRTLTPTPLPAWWRDAPLLPHELVPVRDGVSLLIVTGAGLFQRNSTPTRLPEREFEAGWDLRTVRDEGATRRTVRALHETRSLPDPRVARWGRAVRADTWQRWARTVAALLETRVRRHACHAVGHADDVLTGGPILYETPTVRTLITLAPRARSVWAGVVCQGDSLGSSEVPALTVSARTLAGAEIDPGVTWSERDLPSRPAGSTTVPIALVHTGVREAAPGDDPSLSPRALDVSGYGGQTIEVVAEGENLRILDVIVFERSVRV